MAAPVDICNRAMQKLGAKRMASLSDDSANAKECNACYESLRDAELMAHPWIFAIKRATLAEDASPPDWGKAHAFELPVDCLRVLPPYPEDNTLDRDWEIEGAKIYTNEGAPLYVRYVRRVTNVEEMPALFREALASRIAAELCERITQSNTKKAAALEDYKLAVKEARRVNAMQRLPQQAPTDSFLSVR